MPRQCYYVYGGLSLKFRAKEARRTLVKLLYLCEPTPTSQTR